MFESPVEIGIATLAGGLVKALYDRYIKDSSKEVVLESLCKERREECAGQKIHDIDDIKEDLKSQGLKINCIDLKLARILGFFEARGWVEPERKA